MSILLLAQPEPIAEFPEIVSESEGPCDLVGLGLFAETDQLAEETEALALARTALEQRLSLHQALKQAVHEARVPEVHQPRRTTIDNRHFTNPLNYFYRFYTRNFKIYLLFLYNY